MTYRIIAMIAIISLVLGCSKEDLEPTAMGVIKKEAHALDDSYAWKGDLSGSTGKSKGIRIVSKKNRIYGHGLVASLLYLEDERQWYLNAFVYSGSTKVQTIELKRFIYDPSTYEVMDLLNIHWRKMKARQEADLLPSSIHYK